MTFVVTLIALLIERFFDWSHLRQWNWFASWERYLMQRFRGANPYFQMAIALIPLLLFVALISYALQGVLYGFITLVFQLSLLLYCLGPQNLWADTFACINALVHGDTQLATDKVKTSFSVIDPATQSLHQYLLDNIFIAANRRVFAIIFWYLILGPLGAVLYRGVTVAAGEVPAQEISPDYTQAARSVEAALDWVPVRIFTFILALGGHFTQVFNCWRKKVSNGLGANDNMLAECGAAALGAEDIGAITGDGSLEKHAIGLLDRAFVIMLVIVAIAVLLF